MFRRPFVLSAAISLSALVATPAPSASRRDREGRPRLCVVISIDQFRADYLTRFQDLYLPPRTGRAVGGFRYLQSLGAWFPDCRYAHHRTVTGVGHAVIGSGAQPALSGVVGNNWFDRHTKKSVYCVDDPKSTVVGAKPDSPEKPMSPANLLVTTVGDELELATGGEARTVAVSLKDRASILMAGHRADAVVWFDESDGRWISSSYYCKTGKLPDWAVSVNALRQPDALRQTPWTPAVPDGAMRRVWKRPGANPSFSHALTGKTYTPFAVSPSANAFTLDTALAAAKAEGLGQDEIPDILSINLASNDYVGHAYGPDSAEVLDISVQTDRQLSRFFNEIGKLVPGGLAAVTICISADHGVAVIPELNSQSGIPALRIVATAVRAAAEAALDKALGDGDWILSFENGELYFNDVAVNAAGHNRTRMEEIVGDALRSIPGVHSTYGRTAILQGRVPNTAIGRRLGPGVHPTRSGDVVVILDPHWLPGTAPVGTGTSHGTPFPYDSHVVLLMGGPGIRPGTYAGPVQPAQIAPSLSHILRIARPSGADEPLLPSADG